MPGQTTTQRSMSPLGAAFWVIVLWQLEHVSVIVTEVARPGALTDVVNLTACEVLAPSVVAFAIARVHAREVSLRSAFGVGPLAAWHMVLSAIAGAGLCPLLSTLNDFIVRRWPYDDPVMVENLRKLLASSSPIVIVVGGLVVVPIVHELFFRGILFQQLRRSTSPFTAIIATTALFALSSLGDWRAIPSALGLGVALAWVRERSGTVLSAIAMHLAFCSVEGIPILRGRDPAADVTYPSKWIAVGALAAALSAAAIGVGARRKQ